MITDALLQLSSAQAVTATAVSINSIDLGAGVRDLGPGEDLYFALTFDQAFATATSVNFQVITGTNSALTAGVTVLIETGAMPIAQLITNREPIFISIPNSIYIAQPIGQRYLGLQYTVGGANATAGQVTANVVHGPQFTKHLYPTSFVVN